MIEKNGMHRFTDVIIAPERERQVAHPTTDMRPRKVLLNPSRCTNEIDGIVIVFLDARCHRKDIRVEDDVMRIEAHLFGKDAIGTTTNLNLPFVSIGLPLLIESHDYGCGS